VERGAPVTIPCIEVRLLRQQGAQLCEIAYGGCGMQSAVGRNLFATCGRLWMG
jgi:hypothetical protein